MVSPEDMGPQSWTKHPGEGLETEAAIDEEMERRTEQANEYVSYYLEGADQGLEMAAMSVINGDRSDLENENYWRVGLAERLQLSPDDVDRLAGFVAQLKLDRGWVDEEGEEGASAPETAPVTGESPAAEAATEISPAETVEAEPIVFDSKEAAYEAFQANVEAMNEDLEALQLVEDDPYQTLQNFFAVLKKHAVNMKIRNGSSEVEVRGLPLTLDQSGVPPEEWDDWGGPDRLSSGSIDGLQRQITVSTVTQPDFSMRSAVGSYYPKAVEETLDRLFGQQN